MNPGADPMLPEWAREIIALYESHAASQFLLHGNVGDHFLIQGRQGAENGLLTDYLEKVLMPGFDVILQYDLAHGLRVEQGGDRFAEWPSAAKGQSLPRQPRPALETLAHYFRYIANLSQLGRRVPSVGLILCDAHLVLPASQGPSSHELAAMALLVREWATDPALTAGPLAVCLIAENLHDLHPIVSASPRLARVTIPMPDRENLARWLQPACTRYPVALSEFQTRLPELAGQLAGASLVSIENLLKLKQYRGETIAADDLVGLKKQLVENESQELVEFIESKRSLDSIHAQDRLKQWLRDDIALWQQGDSQAMPMGYLLCGPVGTGKTFLVECLAGEAGVPVVKIKNFRDKWIGSTEGNLEKIFRMLQGLGRCFVFIDEADQALGKRESGSGDSGLSGRIYSMFAKEMSDPANRGRIIWVLASSRPDLIEVDLKRPGRVDVKIPIFPTTTIEETFALVKALCGRRDLELTDADFEQVRHCLPRYMTPGAAEALSVKVYRDTRVRDLPAGQALRESLEDYQHPVPWETMRHQIGLAVKEASDMEFVPELFRAWQDLTGYQ